MPGKVRYLDAVTLTIESGHLRYLTTKGGKVERWGKVALEPGLVAEGMVTNALEVGKSIDALFTAEKLQRKRVTTAISGQRSIPRLLALPKLQASMLAEAISREARKEMPIALDSLYLSWQSMPGVGEQQRVYVVGIPREIIDGQVRALQAGGITPYVMDLKPLALIRAVKKQEAIIVNLEQDELDITLVVDYLPAIMRTFSLQNENLERTGMLTRLVNELSQTVRFYNDSHRGTPIKPATPCFATGELLDDRESLGQLQNLLERQVERAQSPLPCPDDFPAMAYMVNVGLAMKKA